MKSGGDMDEDYDTSSYGQADYWWLRSPGNFYHIAFFVNSSGDVDRTNYYGVWEDSYGLSSYISIYSITPS